MMGHVESGCGDSDIEEKSQGLARNWAALPSAKCQDLMAAMRTSTSIHAAFARTFRQLIYTAILFLLLVEHSQSESQIW